jgi:mono/diheme cytochrome c family protein
LVERHDFVAIPGLERLAAHGTFPSAVHALWALEGLGALSSGTIERSLASSDAKVRATAICVSEPLLEQNAELGKKILSLSNDPALDVQVQLMFTLGQIHTSEAEAVMLKLLARNPAHPLLRDACISGLKQRELAFLQRLLAAPDWRERNGASEKIIRELSRCIVDAREPGNVSQLLSLASAQDSRWIQYAMLDGFSAIAPAKAKGKAAPSPKVLRLSSQPQALAQLAALNDAGLNDRLKTIEPLLAWPGKAGLTETAARPLTEAEKKLFDAGKAQYPLICGACHQPTGLGLDGLAPPLVDSDWSTGSPGRMVRIALQGVRGPLNVKGRTWELEMPPVAVLSDEQIAALLTYIRREWGHTASPVSAEFVAKIRKETATREEAWTEAELLKIDP